MNLNNLNLLSLHVLARGTLDESLDIAARLSYHENLNGRLFEVENAWNGYSHQERVYILAAMALDLSEDGFKKRVIVAKQVDSRVLAARAERIRKEKHNKAAMVEQRQNWHRETIGIIAAL